MFDVAIEILNKIYEKGKEAYIVGGFCRDKYLGINSLDIDITTSATIEDLLEIFDDVENKGFLSYRLKYKNFIFEITTYRKELNYIENRYPIVEIANSLQEDLKRRDFTINTLCIDKNGNYVDLLNAKEDLNKKIIRCVGNSEIKIKEDALRILRAIRFAVTLDFDLDNNLAQDITKYAYLIKTIPSKKAEYELKKIIKYKNNAKELIKKLKIEEYFKELN